MNPVPDTVGRSLAAAAERCPERVALLERLTGRRCTYAELDERTTRLADALLGIGLHPGDRVAAWMEDRIEYVEVYLAAAKAGLVVAPINARFVTAEAVHQLDDSEARALVWTPGVAERVTALGARTDGMLTVAVGASTADAGHRLEDLVASGRPRLPRSPGPEDLYILGYTSGTTGRPKGAMLTHRSVLSIGRQNAFSFRLSGHAIMALTGSMSFVAVVPSHVLMGVGIGSTTIIMGRWSVEELLDTVEREGATFTYVPSPLLSEFAAAARARPEALRTLNAVLQSASRVSPETLRDVFDAVGDRLVVGWGMTEHSGGLATATTRDDYLDVGGDRDPFAAMGRSAVGVAVRLADEAGRWLPHDGITQGELLVRSPSLMSGYWRRPDATAEAMRDGWYRTGDLGSIDPDGHVVVSERRTDLIVSGGMNVYPSEVEDCIQELAAVAEVGVVGVPHPQWGQTVAAAVVPVAGAEVTDEEVISHCRARLASFKKPAHVVFVEHLPRTTSMKLARAELREAVTRAVAASRVPD